MPTLAATAVVYTVGTTQSTTLARPHLQRSFVLIYNATSQRPRQNTGDDLIPPFSAPTIAMRSGRVTNALAAGMVLTNLLPPPTLQANLMGMLLQVSLVPADGAIAGGIGPVHCSRPGLTPLWVLVEGMLSVYCFTGCILS